MLSLSTARQEIMVEIDAECEWEGMQESLHTALRVLVDEAAMSLSTTRQDIIVEIDAECMEGMQESLHTARQYILDIYGEEGSAQETANTSRPGKNSERPLSLTSTLNAASKDISKVQAELRAALKAGQCVSTEQRTTVQRRKATTKDAQPSPVFLSQSNRTTSVRKTVLPANVSQLTKLRPTSSQSRTPRRQSPMPSTPGNRHASGTYFRRDSSSNASDSTTASESHASPEKAKKRPSKESKSQSFPLRSACTSQRHGPQAWLL